MKHIIFNNGVEHWLNKDGNYHRDDGGPAIIISNGSESWYKNDYLHRENNPAYVRIEGYMEWWKRVNRWSKELE